MKLYTYPSAPSPMRVELMLQYKGVSLDSEIIDMRIGEQLQAPYRSINPRCTTPALVLEDGTLLTEVIAICLYLDSQYPDKPVFGRNDLERALVINWMHRIFTEGFLACAEALRNASPGMKNRALTGPDDFEQIPALAERGRKRLPLLFNELNQHLQNRRFVVGEALSQADIDALVIVRFSGWIKLQPGDDLTHLQAWRARVEEMLSPD